MVLENPFVIDAEHGGIKRTGHIRHMKHGEIFLSHASSA
jgi:hypothetical protein